MIWPFTEIKALRKALAQANETNRLAISNFDSLHKAHMELMELLRKDREGNTVVMAPLSITGTGDTDQLNGYRLGAIKSPSHV